MRLLHIGDIGGAQCRRVECYPGLSQVRQEDSFSSVCGSNYAQVGILDR